MNLTIQTAGMEGTGAEVVFLAITAQISIEIREGGIEITEGVTEIETLTRILQWLTCPHSRTMLPQLSLTSSFRITSIVCLQVRSNR